MWAGKALARGERAGLYRITASQILMASVSDTVTYSLGRTPAEERRSKYSFSARCQCRNHERTIIHSLAEMGARKGQGKVELAKVRQQARTSA